MPLAPRYTWSETESVVCIDITGVALKDASQLLVGHAVVKLSAAPHFLLLDLAAEVDPCASRATVQGASLHLELPKVGASAGLALHHLPGSNCSAARRCAADCRLRAMRPAHARHPP